MEVTRRVVLPDDPAGHRVQGVDVRAVVIDDSRSEVGDAVLHEYATVDRPGRGERTVDGDVSFAGRGSKTPQQAARCGLQGVNPPVATADVRPAVPDGGGILDRAGGGVLPARFTTVSVQGAHLAILAGHKDQATGGRGGGRYLWSRRCVLPAGCHRGGRLGRRAKEMIVIEHGRQCHAGKTTACFPEKLAARSTAGGGHDCLVEMRHQKVPGRSPPTVCKRIHWC